MKSRRESFGENNIDRKEENNLNEIEKYKQEHQVFPDAETRFLKTIESLDLEPVSKIELENEENENYPSFEEWIEIKASKGGKARTYPSFVKNKETQEIYFCKAMIRPKWNWGGVKKESLALSAASEIEGVSVPKLLHYVPESNESLEAIIVESIKFSEGQISPKEEWNPNCAYEAANVIKKLENHPIENFPDIDKEPEVTVDGEFKRSQDILEKEFSDKLNQILENYNYKDEIVFIHGDTWTKNIIIKNQEETFTSFIDWERGGAGYKGQDIARLWWELWDSNQKAQSALIDSYFQDENNSKEDQIKSLKFGVMFEALRWIGDRNDKLKLNLSEDKKDEIRDDIKSVQGKALKMLSQL